MKMKKIGILGGLAWPATVEYYKALCLLSQEHFADSGIPGPPPMPEMVIESVNINHSFNRRGSYGDEGSWAEYDAYFRSALLRLEGAGADFLIIASNTPHTRYGSITAGLGVPVLGIFEAVAQAAREIGIGSFLLLGTDPTMNSGVFQELYRERGIEAFAPPDPRTQKKVVDLISELTRGGCANGEPRMDGLVRESYASRNDQRMAVCLACTELPLAFADRSHLAVFEEGGVLYLNTTIIHARAAFRYALEG